MIPYKYKNRKNKMRMGDFNMEKDLMRFLGLNEAEVVTNYGDIDSDKIFNKS
jgi:hypothetical protein